MTFSDYVAQVIALRKMASAVQPRVVSPKPIEVRGNPVMIFSPHPDDECIIGGFPIRLREELGLPLINVAVTLGSNLQRREPRLNELTDACKCLGMQIIRPKSAELPRLSPELKREDPESWLEIKEDIAALIVRETPSWVLYPHSDDWNSTHKAVSLLVRDAIEATGSGWSGGIIESEFWKPMAEPNVLVGLSEKTVSSMINALAWHVGEVARNPYHLSLPAWLMDSVRRGAEWVGGQGGAAPVFPFGTLYRLSLYRGEKFEEHPDCPQILSPKEPLPESFLNPAK